MEPSPPQQPVDTITWTPADQLHANDYNPNHVAPPELRLLKLSILEDGWTQPIVARPDGEIVDGYHRWTLATQDPDVRNLTAGLVPVATLNPNDPAHQRMSTIRHNRARGEHHVLKMADIVGQVIDEGLDPDEVGRRLGMEQEEVRRLKDRGHMPTHSGQPEFNNGWTPG